MSDTAVVKPVRAMAATIQPRRESARPIALSMPCTGKGVCTSQRVKPASRTFSAAWSTSAGVSYSASIRAGAPPSTPALVKGISLRLPWDYFASAVAAAGASAWSSWWAWPWCASASGSTDLSSAIAIIGTQRMKRRKRVKKSPREPM
jgi:hypothetical protein